jgi:hypothetical protein
MSIGCRETTLQQKSESESSCCSEAGSISSPGPTGDSAPLAERGRQVNSWFGAVPLGWGWIMGKRSVNPI